MLRNLTVRDLQPEVMDQPNLEPHRHEQALAGLARVNGLSNISSAVWRPIACMAALRRLHELSVLDIASGGGDVGIGLARRAQSDGIRVLYTGYDVSPTAVSQAQRRAESFGVDADTKFAVRDVFAEPIDGSFDVVMCSLFLHHLDEVQAVELLARMRGAARRLVVVNDLLRSRLGYTAAHVVCRVVTRSDVVHYDGPQSVAAAFQLDEVRRLADRAGLSGAVLRKVWPFRFLLTWEPSP